MSAPPLQMGEWVPLGEALRGIEARFMFRDPRFVLDNWDCKYLDVRIDMRTGSAYVKPGNDRLPVPQSATLP